MKLYISADIEGVAGLTHWDEANKTKSDYEYFRNQMTKEVAAAFRGAVKAGFNDILVQDAHGSGRNIISRELPREARILRGWSRSPLAMVQELNEIFDALIYVGYHSPASSDGHPLSHTMKSSAVAEMRINGERISEFTMHSYAAGYLGVPVVFVSGDKKLNEDVKKFNNNISTYATSEGIGNSTISVHPDLAIEEIERIVEEALKKDLNLCKVDMPQEFILEIEYVHHFEAYKSSFYPGAELINEKTVRFKSNNYMDVLTAITFLVSYS